MNKPLNYISEKLRLDKPLGKPIIRTIEPTNACMMTCRCCPRRYMKRKIEFMDLDFFKKIIDQAKWNTGMDFSQFGDPLMHPQLDKMIKYCEDRNIKTMLAVNPNLLTKKNNLSILKAGVSSIGISIDGLNDEQYKFYRGQNADYELAKENVRNLLEIKRQLNSDVEIHISGIMNETLKNSFEKFKKIWNDLGIVNVQQVGYKVFDGSNSELYQYGTPYKSSGAHCSESWVGFSVVASGKVVPCCFDYDEKVVLGDLKKQTLLEIWEGESMINLRREFKSGIITNPLCKNCPTKQEISLSKLAYGKLRRIIWGLKNKG